jgi:lipopolysaccharide transport system ATP-binding protein
MSDIVIKAENLGKMYTIGHRAERGGYTSLRDVLMQNARNLWNKTKDLAMGKPIIQGDMMEEVWALKDVSFEIRRGEAVGIIGRNGAGKSTLLKILSRITEPSCGRVTIKGCVASLLEVGTGFHPELTGRENIYLNGTILGMTRVEIKQKFDEIVAFAEVEKYLDTPVKRYSSGMYVRLAFAVAAHLDTEILVVDEVLAVGDSEFQKKCLGKMGDVATEGRTVLFVSHNLAAISNLCSRCMLLENGRIGGDGMTQGVINQYIEQSLKTDDVILPDYSRRKGDGKVRFAEVKFFDSNFNPIKIAVSGKDLIIAFYYVSCENKSLRNVIICVGFFGTYKQFLFLCGNEMTGDILDDIPSKGGIILTIPNLPLSQGLYGFNFHLSVNGVMSDWVQEDIPLRVVEGDFYCTGKLPPETHGGFLVNHSLKIEYSQQEKT